VTALPAAFSDPLALAAACLAVVLVGLSKGGLGGAMALLGVPLMALAMPPVQAAAILLPILLVMDSVSLWVWRRSWDGTTLKLTLPGALVGIAAGWATAAVVSDAAVRLIVGALTLVFTLRHFLAGGGAAAARPHRPVAAAFWGAGAGFTSFVAHAGGPPFQMYALPLKLDPARYVGTSVIFFAVVNVVKLAPYFALGQFGMENLAASALLAPLAVVSTAAGAWVVKRVSPGLFYRVMYAAVAVVSLKLIWDGARAFW
jgi:uncharacterized membrane protein YfcA